MLNMQNALMVDVSGPGRPAGPAGTNTPAPRPVVDFQKHRAVNTALKQRAAFSGLFNQPVAAGPAGGSCTFIVVDF